MRYVALLRGINVGGNSMVDMRELRAVFEGLGFESVRTYINSGNVLFTAPVEERPALTARVESAIEARFGFPVPTLVRDIDEVRAVVEALPADWVNDATQKCDVFFLWEAADRPSVLDELTWDPAIDDVVYTPGAVLRRAFKPQSGKTKLTRVVGTPLYKLFTIRNCNTARKLLELMEE